jgi:hypothetical protein
MYPNLISVHVKDGAHIRKILSLDEHGWPFLGQLGADDH